MKKQLKGWVWLVCLLVACAKQGFPPGGPIDKTPPRIVKVYPPPDSTGVDTRTWVEFTFSESVDRRSVEEALFISPNPGDLKYRWKGKRLKIEFLDTLKKGRTYVVTLGTDVKDLRNNRMKESFTLAFSTGDSLDKGEISGRVFGEGRVEGALVWAYLLEENGPPDPMTKRPDYVTQCDSEGRFSLSYLSPGRYRLFAVIDKNRDRRYDPEYDALGVGTSDVLILPDSLKVGNRCFRVAVRDTTRPSLLSAMTPDKHHITLRFSEGMSEKNVASPASYQIITLDSSETDSLEVLMAYRDPLNSALIHLISEEQEGGREYLLEVKGLYDLAGNEIDTSYNRVSFWGSTRPDTLKPRIISYFPPDSARDFSPWDKIYFVFDEAMDQGSFERGFSLTDSLGKPLSGEFNWENPARVQFLLKGRLQSLMTYRIQIDPDSVTDLFGNTLADSLINLIFIAVNRDTLSAIRGKVIDEDSNASGRIYLIARQAQRGGKTYRISLEAPGGYSFEDIFPGIYLIEGFRDADGDGEYSFGSPFPFSPAERFVVYPDSIKVRSRWPNEGNDIVFPR